MTNTWTRNSEVTGTEIIVNIKIIGEVICTGLVEVLVNKTSRFKF